MTVTCFLHLMESSLGGAGLPLDGEEYDVGFVPPPAGEDCGGGGGRGRESVISEDVVD